VTENLTKRIQAAIVESDVVVHAEPLAVKSENLVARIRSEASNFNEIKNIHNIRVFEINGKLAVDFHLELEGDLPLSKAHDLSTELEAQIKKLDNSIASVSSHVEPIDGGVANGNLDKKASEKLKTELDAIIMAYTDVGCYKNLEIKNVGGKLCVTLDCRFKKDITVNDAHRTADQLEAVIRSKIKEIDTVSIHLEPSS
jgi:divalent metal cation (Fe/Co/Zn/Cd) transporter